MHVTKCIGSVVGGTALATLGALAFPTTVLAEAPIVTETLKSSGAAAGWQLALTEAAPATETPPVRPNPCSVRLEQAWRTLGHFSDGFERYLLHQPPCNTNDLAPVSANGAIAALHHLLALTRVTHGTHYRLDGAYSAGAALTRAAH